MMVANSNEAAKPLLVEGPVRRPSLSLDGFQFPQTDIELDLNLNTWTHWKVTKVEIVDYYINMREVAWKGQSISVEFDYFMGLVSQMMEGDIGVMPKYRKRKQKGEVLDLIFEMAV